MLRIIRECLLVFMLAFLIAALWLRSTAAASPAENEGCQTDTCKMIDEYYSCTLQTGAKLSKLNCYMCIGEGGRCDSGNAGLCLVNSVQYTRRLATMGATECDCGEIDNEGTVQAFVTAYGRESVVLQRSVCDQ
jgi:hypothetical protein